MLQYSQDYDESLVAPIYHTNAGGYYESGTFINTSTGVVNYSWEDAIYPYIKSTQVFVCPSHSGPRAKFKLASDFPSHDGSAYGGSDDLGSYVINAAYKKDTGDPYTPPVSFYGSNSDFYTTRLAKVQAASTTAWVMDGVPEDWGGAPWIVWDNPGTQSINLVNNIRQYPGTGTDDIIQERHLETVNTLYVDGHVKAIKLDALTKEKAVPGCTQGCNGSGQGIVAPALTIEDD